MTYLIGLGSNVGDRKVHLRAALDALPGRLLAVSALYETDPVGPVAQDDFLNAACLLETGEDPPQLLERLLAIEAREGRRRTVPKGPRTLDLDILWWSGGAFHEGGLEIPHPELLNRAFALLPALDVAPGVRLPDGRRLRECPLDPAGVRRIEDSMWPRATT